MAIRSSPARRIIAPDFSIEMTGIVSNGSMTATAQPVLSVTNLQKYYGSKLAVEDISFFVRPNEIVGLLGPNGAGKTTTINMILSILEPTAGHIAIAGVDLVKERSKAL